MLAALALAAALAQAPSAAEAPPPVAAPLTVTGRRPGEGGAPTVARFVEKLARPKDRLTPRWMQPPCPTVTGLDDEAARLVLDRIVALAREAGAPVRPAACGGSLLVVFTDDPKALDAGLRDSPWMRVWDDPAGDYRSEQRRFFASAAPVRWWRVIVTRENPLVDQPSKLKSPTVAEVVRVVVAVDVREAERLGLTLGQLADYAAMVGLAAPPFDGDYRGADSILALFDPGGARPHGATAWDVGYLKGLFLTDPSLLTDQARGIRAKIAQEPAR